jgi:hypothetical protein
MFGIKPQVQIEIRRPRPVTQAFSPAAILPFAVSVGAREMRESMESASGWYEPLTLKHAEGIVDGLAEGQEASTLQAGQFGGKRKSRVNGPSTKPLLGP